MLKKHAYVHILTRLVALSQRNLVLKSNFLFFELIHSIIIKQ